MPSIKLIKLDCLVNDEIDEDEVYLKYKGKKIWPEDKRFEGIDIKEEFEIGITIDYEDRNKAIEIELWDFDYLSRNDFLGVFEMTVGNDTDGEYSTSMKVVEKGSTASYVLHWEIL